MGNVRPVGITLVAIWFFIAGLVAAVGGALHAFWYQTFFGLLGFAVLLFGGPGGATQIVQVLLIVIGVVLVVSGLAYWVVAVGLLQGREWGRSGGIAASIGAAVGWIGLGIVTLAVGIGFFSIFYLVFGLFNALPILYLVSDEARQYCGGAYEPVLAPTVPPTLPPPTPVVTAPPPVQTSVVPQRRLAATEVIGAAQPPSAWFVMRAGNRAGKQFGLHRGKHTIGRDGAQCDLVLDDTTVSQRHAEVHFENGQFVLYDLASTNGTFVNNQRVQRQTLLDGDDVRVGNISFVFKEVKLRPVR